MARILYAAVVFSLLLGMVICQTTQISSENHIHQLIQSAKDKCGGHCQDTAKTVLDRNVKDDMCTAVNLYALCASVACNGGDNVKSLYVQAQEICNDSSAVQVSMITIVMAAIVRFLF